MPNKKVQRKVKATDKQWLFALEYVKSQGAMFKAYDATYPEYKDRPLHWKRGQAKRTLNMKGTQYAIQELRNDSKVLAKKDLSAHLQRVTEIGDAAFEKGNYATALKSEMYVGEVLGFHKKDVNVTVTPSAEGLRQQMQAFLEQYPQMMSLVLPQGLPERLFVENQAEQDG